MYLLSKGFIEMFSCGFTLKILHPVSSSSKLQNSYFRFLFVNYCQFQALNGDALEYVFFNNQAHDVSSIFDKLKAGWRRVGRAFKNNNILLILCMYFQAVPLPSNRMV